MRNWQFPRPRKLSFYLTTIHFWNLFVQQTISHLLTTMKGWKHLSGLGQNRFLSFIFFYQWWRHCFCCFVSLSPRETKRFAQLKIVKVEILVYAIVRKCNFLIIQCKKAHWETKLLSCIRCFFCFFLLKRKIFYCISWVQQRFPDIDSGGGYLHYRIPVFNSENVLNQFPSIWCFPDVLEGSS